MFPRSHRTLDGSVLVMCDTGGPGLTLVLVSDTYMLTRVNRSNWRPDIWIQAKHSRGVVLTTIWITYLAFLRQHQTSAPITLCLEIQESSAEDCILYPKSKPPGQFGQFDHNYTTNIKAWSGLCFRGINSAQASPPRCGHHVHGLKGCHCDNPAGPVTCVLSQ